MSLSLTYEYDRSFRPSFPAVDLLLVNPDDETKRIEVVGLIDSGSDGTMIPLIIAQELDLYPTNGVYVRGVTGKRKLTHFYGVNLHIGRRSFWDFDVMTSEHEDRVLIGRDILNYFRITLDGTALTTEIAIEGE